MLVFLSCIKHPANSLDYQEVWRQLNDTLFSICSQKHKDFKVIVVCDKKLPLIHHHQLIEPVTEFIEVSFGEHSQKTLDDFDKFGSLTPSYADPDWWDRWSEADFRRGKPDGYFHIANVVLNMGSKFVIGLIAARKYTPNHIAFFDGDDYLGNDISFFTNARKEDNGWIMTHGYKLSGNILAPQYDKRSFCGTGNILNYKLISPYIPTALTPRCSLQELFETIDPEFLVTLGKHRNLREYFSKKGYPLMDFPTRSVLYNVGTNESSETTLKKIRRLKSDRLHIDQKSGDPFILNETHSDYFNLLPPHEQRVICIGFQKTGTSSMQLLLRSMGYHVSGSYRSLDPRLIQLLSTHNLSSIEQHSQLYNAYQDGPWFLLYKEMDQWYPGSKFILTIRDEENWWSSFLNYFGNDPRPLFEYIFGFNDPNGHKDEFIQRYQQHNRQVLEYFKDRPNDLLVVDVSTPDALHKIIKFIGKKTPFKKMPHANAKLTQPETIRQLELRKRIRSVKRFIKSNINGSRQGVMSLSHKPPIIINGNAFSGAKYLLSLLSTHPQLYASQFVPLVPDKNMPNQRTEQGDTILAVDHKRLYTYFSKQFIDKGASRWVAIADLNEESLTGMLKAYSSDVRFINLIRDGRDVITEPDPYLVGKYAVKPEKWITTTRTAIQFSDHPQLLNIRYEDLQSNFTETISKVSSFLNFPDPAPFLNFPIGARFFEPECMIGIYKSPEHRDILETFLSADHAKASLTFFKYDTEI